MSERRDSTRSRVSCEKATLAWGSHAQWNGSDGGKTTQQFSLSWVPAVWLCHVFLLFRAEFSTALFLFIGKCLSFFHQNTLKRGSRQTVVLDSVDRKLKGYLNTIGKIRYTVCFLVEISDEKISTSLVSVGSIWSNSQQSVSSALKLDSVSAYLHL